VRRIGEQSLVDFDQVPTPSQGNNGRGGFESSASVSPSRRGRANGYDVSAEIDRVEGDDGQEEDDDEDEETFSPAVRGRDKGKARAISEEPDEGADPGDFDDLGQDPGDWDGGGGGLEDVQEEDEDGEGEEGADTHRFESPGGSDRSSPELQVQASKARKRKQESVFREGQKDPICTLCTPA
jgi:hypothetical protein